jgi:SAM-dependent methyltransferase
MASFSFLLPTRGKQELAQRFLQSVVDTADHPEEIEVILGVDEDDVPSHAIAKEGLVVKTVVLRPGLTMGELNRACFAASSGRYVMLINDDVIVRTRGWDTVIYQTYARYGDDVALVHVNDLLFRERFCTFPILSRKACLEIEICPACYRRYKIDDHIYDTYCLLSYLGYNRLVYLKDVVFEHENYLISGVPHVQAANCFQSDEGKVYTPNPEIIDADSRDFTDRLEDRKRDARRLARLIETAAVEKRQASHETLLARVRDSHGYRQYCMSPGASSSPAAGNRRSRNVTVAVVTSDLRRRHARQCLSLLKKHTADFELVVLDNNHSRQFNHPQEMNKALRTAKTDFVVLLDDDVFVSPGWLEGLLDSVDDRTGIVTPVHRDRHGRISYSGVYLNGDENGGHAHTTDVPSSKRPCQCICSAAVLIDRTKCGDILFSETYRKYFLDLDYALQVWESGYEVACTPNSLVTHLGGGTMPYTSPESLAGFQRDSATFAATWIKTGRLGRLERGIWSQFDYLRHLNEIPQRIQQTLGQAKTLNLEELRRVLDPLIAELRPVPKFYERLAGGLFEQACVHRSLGQTERADYLETAIEKCSSSPLRIRFGRSVKRRLVPIVKRRLLPTIASLIERYPLVRRAVTAAHAKAASAWRRYKRLPAHVRSVCDPPVMLMKRVVKPLLWHPDHTNLGLYKGFHLKQVDRMIYATPTSPTRKELESAGGNGTCALSAIELSRVKGLVDDLAGRIDGGFRRATHLLDRSAAKHGSAEAIEVYEGVRIVPYEGRYFGLMNGDVFDPAKIRSGHYGTCWVGHSLEDIRLQVDESRRQAGQAATRSSREKALVACNLPDEVLSQYLKSLTEYDVTLSTTKDRWDGTQAFDAFAIPFVPGEYWKNAEYERLATTVAKRLMIVLPDGKVRQYRGEDMHRILYNKSYLGSMLQQVPSIQGKHILDVGCSDGLACDLLLNENPAAVTGIDVMETVGCVYRDPRISYAKMGAESLQFADETFDLSYSIATLEHCSDPYAALLEMKRVTKKGGYIYVQAAPLYYSPFGHHMFGYFDDFPWIHLRLPVEGILDYCRTRQIDARIQRSLGRSAEDYVRDMMNTGHVNGLAYQEYGITEFLDSPDLEVLGFSRTREGESLLTNEILLQLPDIPREDLISHGFELVVRRR